MTDTTLGAVLHVVDAEAAASAPTAAPQVPPVLPSERLVRLAELTAARLTESVDNGGSAGPQVPEQALADVWAAVDASTAANTKKAYRSDWARFTTWASERGFARLPAPALVVAHYLTEAAALQTGVGRWRYTPATLSRWVSSINQFHTAAGLPPPGGSEVVRRALSGVRRISAVPPVRRSPLLLADPHPGHLDRGLGRRVAGRGGGAAGRGVVVAGVRRGAPPVRARRPHRG